MRILGATALCSLLELGTAEDVDDSMKREVSQTLYRA